MAIKDDPTHSRTENGSSVVATSELKIPVGSTTTLNPNENTLLTTQQTYFADEKIQIPDIDSVNNPSDRSSIISLNFIFL